MTFTSSSSTTFVANAVSTLELEHLPPRRCVLCPRSNDKVPLRHVDRRRYNLCGSKLIQRTVVYLYLLLFFLPLARCFTESYHSRSTSVPLSAETVTRSDAKDEAVRIYFDISIGGVDEGRMVFNLGRPSAFSLPLHTENLIKLCTGELRSLDPRCSYWKCTFKHSPQFVENFSQYRWAHVLEGKGRNAVGRPTERIHDPEKLRACTHSMYGGVYYGLKYDEMQGDEGVVLTVPLVGAFRGSTSFSIVRVGESPQEWQERLLLNSAVLGRLESGIDTLHNLARQTRAPPQIEKCGKL